MLVYFWFVNEKIQGLKNDDLKKQQKVLTNWPKQEFTFKIDLVKNVISRSENVCRNEKKLF